MIHPQAVVSPLAVLEDGVEVGAGAVVEAEARIGACCRLEPLCYVGPGVALGRECQIGPGAVLLAGVVLGDRVRVEAGAVLGSCGFGFVQHEGEHVPIPQVGGVSVGNDSLVGAAATVDRGTTSPTRLGQQVVIGPQAQVAHNVQIGDRSVLESQVGIAGSCLIGSDCHLSPQAGMANHAVLGDRSRLGLRAGTTRKSPPDSDLMGFPARPRRQALRQEAALGRLAWALEQLEGESPT